MATSLLPLLQVLAAILAVEAARRWQPELGPYTMAVTTASSEAQAAFDRGLNHCFNFNQPLARKAFEECAVADPTCAMCHWGLANAWGPFLNSPKKSAADLRAARKAALKAAELVDISGGVSAKEYGLIAAMAERYPAEPTGEIPIRTYEAFEISMAHLLQAMGGADMDVAVLLAEAKMDLQCDEGGYHFFLDNGEWTTRSKEAAALLQQVLDSSPEGRPHPMAAHLYIHLTEQGKPQFQPEGGGAAKALHAAKELLSSYTGLQASHLQHMPAHTLMRTGRYADAVKASLVATSTDEAYLSHGTVPYGPGHNIVAGVIAASMSGMWEAARVLHSRLYKVFSDAPDRADGPAGDSAWNVPLTTPLRLGLFEEVLQASEMPGKGAQPYPRDWPYAEVLHAYARGSALLALGCLTAGEEEMDRLAEAAQRVPAHLDGEARIAGLLLRASVDLHAHSNVKAASLKLQEAVDIQSSFGYSEPPRWHQPVRDCLGQVLLDSGDAHRAEVVFRASLEDFTESAHAMWGLKASLQAQQPPVQNHVGAGEIVAGNTAEVMELNKRISAAWAHADVELLGSCPAFSTGTARRPEALLSSCPQLRRHGGIVQLPGADPRVQGRHD